MPVVVAAVSLSVSSPVLLAFALQCIFEELDAIFSVPARFYRYFSDEVDLNSFRIGLRCV